MTYTNVQHMYYEPSKWLHGKPVPVKMFFWSAELTGVRRLTHYLEHLPCCPPNTFLRLCRCSFSCSWSVMSVVGGWRLFHCVIASTLVLFIDLRGHGYLTFLNYILPKISLLLHLKWTSIHCKSLDNLVDNVSQIMFTQIAGGNPCRFSTHTQLMIQYEY